MNSFLRALKSKQFDGFECDVRLSSDKIPVIVHDSTLLRTHRLNKSVISLTASELSKHNIPTLEQVIQLLSKYPSQKVIFDLKTFNYDLVITFITCHLKNLHRAICLVWKDVKEYKKIKVYRSYNYYFRKIPRNVDGCAFNYNGSVQNINSIKNAFKHGLEVNIYGKDKKKMVNAKKMINNFATITITLEL